MKKCTGSHETTIREFTIDHRGLSLGAVLRDFQGVLGDTPTYSGSGSGAQLLANQRTLTPARDGRLVVYGSDVPGRPRSFRYTALGPQAVGSRYWGGSMY